MMANKIRKPRSISGSIRLLVNAAILACQDPPSTGRAEHFISPSAATAHGPAAEKALPGIMQMGRDEEQERLKGLLKQYVPSRSISPESPLGKDLYLMCPSHSAESVINPGPIQSHPGVIWS